MDDAATRRCAREGHDRHESVDCRLWRGTQRRQQVRHSGMCEQDDHVRGRREEHDFVSTIRADGAAFRDAYPDAR